MRVLLLNQCFYPDHVATAQYLTELALALAAAGHEVSVVASSRGYDNPQVRYPSREKWHGIDIHRIWTPGLGKSAKWRRLVDFASFWISATWILLRLPRSDVSVCLTSPPLISTLGTAIAMVKGGAVVPWVMDLNPDEAVAAGWLRQGGMAERVLSGVQRWSFSKAARIVALDRFMAKRLEAKGVVQGVIHVDPPWSHDVALKWDPAGRESFRHEHGVADRFVVMYSGNHSPCHPLDTVLEAAKRLDAVTPAIHFMFVGGGSEHARVARFAEANGLKNITCLPYQPMAGLSASLSSADLHLVVMGEPFVGIVHPCKIYNILSLGLPFLVVGPPESHLNDLADQLPGRADYARLVPHGQVDELVAELKRAADVGPLPPSKQLRDLAADYGQERLVPRLVALIESCAKA